MDSTEPPVVVTNPRRLWIALLAGLVCALGLTFSLGLATSTPHGAADNGDGIRLYCGAGLRPDTVEGTSAWQPGVVLSYLQATPCPGPPPSSALVALEAADRLNPAEVFDLRTLAWIYVGVASAITAVGAWAVTGRGWNRLAILLPGLVALLTPDFGRFLLSTYGEPAGLIGAYGFVTGVAVLLVTSPADRWPRILALGLVVVGSIWAVSAKVAYAPMLLLAVAVALCIGIGTPRPRWRAHVAGGLAAILLLVAGGALVRDAAHWQYRLYKGTNVQNLIYTLVLTEIPGSATELGLPPAAQRLAGTPRPLLTPDQPGLSQIDNDPTAYRARATSLLLQHPAVALRAVGVGLQATAGSDLRYLVWWPLGAQPDNVAGVTKEESAGAAGSDPVSLRNWLAEMPTPWFPTALVVVGLVAGVFGLLRRRSRPSPPAVLAGIAALAGLGLVVASLGDGYFEIAKHVWLGAFFLRVALWSLVGAVLMLLVSLVFPLRRVPAPRV